MCETHDVSPVANNKAEQTMVPITVNTSETSVEASQEEDEQGETNFVSTVYFLLMKSNRNRRERERRYRWRLVGDSN